LAHASLLFDCVSDKFHGLRQLPNVNCFLIMMKTPLAPMKVA
jgi:hypothetical protein